ncbi:anthrone oxygenase family protein [Phytohabitans houttuyneae]|uniref:DUF1772 domain-containing protein n=1 Tax=Phytohabitans houttuyneae TaxID=1076126 RepID=A0A6V8K5Z5_9ACTN|nr:anthrone oxygenase family protein [Phytohabitans houttuyneae]GFJ77569.1 hypothetical protein Phou_017490 [Phytohabitans houttuyneae]
MRTISLVLSLLTTGLAAGLFYTYSMSVMPGLARVGDRTFVEAMSSINKAILNGWFAIAFGGALLFTAVAALLHLGAGHRAALPWIVAALVLYVAQLAVTFTVNVPLNNDLVAVNLDTGDLAAARERFEAAWVRWNVVRTLLVTGAFGAMIGAALKA